ncbi:hypothetical protein EJB05_49232 [Eragrostis curvula]|uniref:Uncharacterized protein n=1 Tax=Eragrostis curvula TaxID=38414 RepID=A0A5J9T400_9POAL|nr:hypothetical protein EJB05_49232 [Eragrostis curvula]
MAVLAVVHRRAGGSPLETTASLLVIVRILLRWPHQGQGAWRRQWRLVDGDDAASSGDQHRRKFLS